MIDTKDEGTLQIEFEMSLSRWWACDQHDQVHAYTPGMKILYTDFA